MGGIQQSAEEKAGWKLGFWEHCPGWKPYCDSLHALTRILSLAYVNLKPEPGSLCLTSRKARKISLTL